MLIALLVIAGLIVGDFDESSAPAIEAATTSTTSTTAPTSTTEVPEKATKTTTATAPAATTSTTPPTTTTTTAPPTAAAPEAGPTVCDPGSVLGEVFVRINGDQLLVDWTATRKLSPDLNGFYLELGPAKYQLGVKMIDESEVVGFVFDYGETKTSTSRPRNPTE